uniref:Uncharacterized protein n=1 Tax=Arundo donax TaxID=35708 RepID=A0A0A9BEY7_ARUDO
MAMLSSYTLLRPST